MNIPKQTDIWIYRIAIVLSLMVMISMVGSIILAITNQPLSETLIALCAVAAGGLARLIVPSPLSQA